MGTEYGHTQTARLHLQVETFVVVCLSSAH